MKNISIRNTLKTMSVKQKISYIWYYYKIHILSILAVLFLIISFTDSQLTNQEVYFDITYIGDLINVDQLSHIDDTLNQEVLNGSTKETINLDSIFINNSSSDTDQLFQQKFMVKIASKDMDMAIVSKQFFEDNYTSGMFLNLESLKGFSSLATSNYEVIKKNDSNGNLTTYGINIKNLNILSDVDFTTDDNILVVISNSARTNRVLDILKVLLNK